MIESTTVRKHKVTLSDYDYKRDIENRLLLSQVTTKEYAVLEEILFSPIRTTVRKIAKSIDIPEDTALNILQKISKTGLISFEEEAIVVNKETRKYFETELEKFEEDFEPGMEFLQHLLKKVPIHVLPIWYAIPRTSNNIFDSLIEKYLLTPTVYQRYLVDLNFADPHLSAIAQDVLKAPRFEVTAEEIQKKYKLSPEKFQEMMLTLEFHFVCTLSYKKVEDKWHQVATLFHEWKEHLTFLKETAPPAIIDSKKIERYRPTDFTFVEDITSVLLHAKKQPAFLQQKNGSIKFSTPAPDEEYLKRLLMKIELVELAELDNGKLILTDAGMEWLDLRSENRALYLYRHPLNHLQVPEKVLREVEKSILRVLNSGWVQLSDFMKSVYTPVSDGQSVVLRKTGKSWRYQRPVYTPEELKLIERVIIEHLFEAGITSIGTYKGESCICVTPFGQSLFG
ncbi:MAG: hypothetical protein KBA81_04370 [Rhabdochlamydiaceae bacterium]|nr:hypothetical protein [Rhabdochlamydiaceae bacterium]